MSQGLLILFSYSKRAKDYNEKKARLKTLRRKAAERNPDEFTYSMLSSRSKGGRKIANRGNPILSQDVVKLLKTQDSGYLRTMLSKTRRAVAKLEQNFILREGQSAEVLGDPSDQDEAHHVVFVGSEKEQKSYSPATLLSGHKVSGQSTLDQHAINDSEGELVNDRSPSAPKSRQAARSEQEALQQLKLLRKQQNKEQNARRAKLAALKNRAQNLLDAENEIEVQRAKLSNNIGGVTRAGIKWRPRERKK